MLIPTQSSINAASIIGSEDVEGEGLFLLCCHKSADTLLYLMSSSDGRSFNTLKPAQIFAPASGTQRDPSIVKYNNKYWIGHTNSTNTYWTLLSSPDMSIWEKVDDIDMTAIASVYRVWAPEFLLDDDGTLRVFVACSTGGVTTNFQIYEMHATSDDLTSWSTPTVLTGTSLRSNMIDPFCVKREDGYYYIWYKDDDTDYVEIMRSTSLTSGYVKWKTGDWAGWGTPLEAPCVVRLSDSKWRVYLNEHSGLNSVAVYWSDSDSDDWSTATWTTKAAIASPWIVAHPCILRILDFPTARNMIALFQQASRFRGAIVSRAATQTISNSSTTAVSWDTETKDDDSFYASGSQVTASSPGWYVMNAYVKWASNGTGKRVLDLRLNGSTNLASQSSATNATHLIVDAALSIVYFLDKNDYIEATVFQNSGGDLAVSSATFYWARLF